MKWRHFETGKKLKEFANGISALKKDNISSLEKIEMFSGFKLISKRIHKLKIINEKEHYMWELNSNFYSRIDFSIEK